MYEEDTEKNTDMYCEEIEEVAAMETEPCEYDTKITIGKDAHRKEKLDNCWNKFWKSVRGCWATKHSEDTENDRELYIKTTVRELLVYILFLIILVIISFGMTSSLLYYYTKTLNGLFTQTKFDDGSTSYSTASTINDYWKFLNGPVIRGLYWNHWYNGDNVNGNEINNIFYENKLIGVPRIRQVRVPSNSCQIPSDFQKDMKECYAPYLGGNEFRGSFGLANSTAWNYSSEKSLDGRSSSGKVTSYGGGGFYVDLNHTLSDSMNTINYLFNNLWIDKGTRAVILDFTVYNANINLFCVIKFVAEFPPTGGIIPNSEFRSVKLIRYVTTTDYCIMACEFVFVLFIIYYAIEEALEIKKHGLEYFASIWNLMDLIVILISLVCSAFNVYRTLTVQGFLTKLLSNQNVYPNFDFLSYWQIQFNYATAFTLFIAWVKIFKYISFNKTMTQLTSTLSACSKDLAGFAVMFFIVFLAFAQLGYLMFGSQCISFNKLENSIYTLFRIILGDFDFNELQKANRVLGPLYFIVYVFFVFFILFQMFLAIIYETFCEVKEELKDAENEFEMADFFKQRAIVMLNKLSVKRDKILDIESALKVSDTNNDNRLDFDEWKTELKIRGYADQEIEAVFSQYDKDGDRVLDLSERKNMLNDMESQKIALTNEISKNKMEIVKQNDSDDGPLSKSSAIIKEYHNLTLQVDHMEKNVSSIVTRIDRVLQNLANIEMTKSKNRETMDRILSTLTSDDNLNEEDRKKKLQNIVNEEIEKMNRDSLASLRPKSGASGASDFPGK